MEETMDVLELGNFIKLSGFKEIDRNSMVIVKKMLGNFLREMMQKDSEEALITLNLKSVHKTEEQAKKYELKINLEKSGKVYHAELVDNNIFVGISDLLKKISQQLSK